jgi:hypothetical protein
MLIALRFIDGVVRSKIPTPMVATIAVCFSTAIGRLGLPSRRARNCHAINKRCREQAGSASLLAVAAQQRKRTVTANATAGAGRSAMTIFAMHAIRGPIAKGQTPAYFGGLSGRGKIASARQTRIRIIVRIPLRPASKRHDELPLQAIAARTHDEPKKYAGSVNAGVTHGPHTRLRGPQIRVLRHIGMTMTAVT